MPKVEKSPQRTLDIKEAWMTIQSCDPSTNKGVRDRAIVALLIGSGLRASELCRLRIDDISFGIEVSDPFLGTLVEISQTTVLRKGGKKEPAYFGPITTRWIRTWLQIRDNVAKNGVEELFVSIGGTKPGTALTRDGLRVIIRNLAQQAGVKHFSPHALRRSFACLLNEAGASTRNIQLFGGWSNIREVETYTQAVEISRQYARYNPVGFLNKVAEQEKLRQKNTGFD